MPNFIKSFEPDRITLSLEIGKTSDKKQATKTIKSKESIIVYLTSNNDAKCPELEELIGLSNPRTRAILNEMITDEIIVAEGGNKIEYTDWKADNK